MICSKNVYNRQEEFLQSTTSSGQYEQPMIFPYFLKITSTSSFFRPVDVGRFPTKILLATILGSMLFVPTYSAFGSFDPDLVLFMPRLFSRSSLWLLLPLLLLSVLLLTSGHVSCWYYDRCNWLELCVHEGAFWTQWSYNAIILSLLFMASC